MHTQIYLALINDMHVLPNRDKTKAVRKSKLDWRLLHTIVANICMSGIPFIIEDKCSASIMEGSV